ncbi:adenylate kinase [Candidatus Erwinia haradaeae]|uniref:Adenylate kinase n=1 Tax=Candidatus Erwinia haradaeae TaxID=1922217 RepID=A0A451D2H1_9GAMM|nr:adenylate kinase [Candidatus Erwinia haradaeae]VFP79822.1 Adenylate kinase [Candidatus Erwinia haradaeae]
MRIILLGAPGSGKGTQAQFIFKQYGIPIISTGEMLRTEVQCNSKHGKKIKKIIDTGNLVTDDLVIALVQERIHQKDCHKGFLLDGFPRTLSQAHTIKSYGIKIDYVFKFCISDELVIQRITGRRIHDKSGRIYHIKFNPPKIPNKDDLTGETLRIREDDREEIIYKRLSAYHKITKPLISYYHQETQKDKIKYYQFDSTKSVTQIHEDITHILDDKM